MKKVLSTLVSLLLVTTMAVGCGSSGTGGNYTVSRPSTNSAQNQNATEASSDQQETERTQLGLVDDVDADTARKGLERVEASGNKDAYTILVYIIGADLESQGGMASLDIQEMLNASFGDNINLVLQTGGTTEWQNFVMDASTVERYEIKNGGITKVGDLGLIDMTKEKTLTDFLKWGVDNYPADRYGAILWDHGGGTMGGFGVDENFTSSSGMGIYQLKDAFRQAGVYFDFVGFDACLMATVEIAYALKDYANYLIASEESEAGTGWYYTEWLNELGKDPYMPIETIGRNIIDGFLLNADAKDIKAGYEENEKNMATLSMIDLGQIKNVVDQLLRFYDKSIKVLGDNGYAKLAKARTNCRTFGNNGYEQVDLLDYIDNAALSGSFDLQKAARDCIIYNNCNISGSNGLAMYYPYYQLSSYGDVSSDMRSVGFEDDYFKFFDAFCSVLAYAQEDESTDEDWYSEEEAENAYTGETVTDDEELEFEQNANGQWVIALSENDWDIIAGIKLEILCDCEDDTLLDLGSDNIYSLDDDRFLLADFDMSWIALDGNVVPSYFMEDGKLDSGEYYSISYIPAEFEGEDIQILVVYTEDSNSYYMDVLGYVYTDDGETNLADRYYYEFEEGDEFKLYGQFYDYNLNDAGLYYLRDAVRVDADGLSVSYEDIDSRVKTYMRYCITDVYRNDYYTEWIRVN